MQTNNDDLFNKLTSQELKPGDKIKEAMEALLAEIDLEIHRPAEMKKLRDKLIAAEERIEELRLELMDRDSRDY